MQLRRCAIVLDQCSELPKNGRLVGVDPGLKRIGVAICNSEQTIATPLAVVCESEPLTAAREIKKLCDENNVVGVVVGLALNLSGQKAFSVKNKTSFRAAIGEVIKLPIVDFDERFSTSLAHGAMSQAGKRSKKRRSSVDSAAAAVILQGYIDRSRNKHGQ